ncbi:dihydroneopterin aldolase [Alistipes sp. ZOR0009]|jgi:dihydroneopterin aldolase|uniref:dihydroneopterin aldolase n=1 Tax=Alistipes sp. ZOR0009 TaxID=1339253 RepID=UPI0006476192|nr:dihydroneopterin aldolase [Alistipes sp. ZOR0009]
MQGIIEIENMEFYAYHGCFEEEAIVGNKFKVDLTIEMDAEVPSKTDSIGDAVNYQLAYNIVKREVAIRSHLLEHVGGRIIEGIYNELSGVQKVKVKVSKMNPPMGGAIEKVSVTLIK